MAAVTHRSVGRAHREPAALEVVPAAVSQLGRLVNQLVEGGEDVVCELDLGDGEVARRRQANREGDDALLAQRSVENALSSEVLVEVVRAAEDSAELYVFAKNV